MSEKPWRPMDLDGFDSRPEPSSEEMHNYYLDHMYRDGRQIPADEKILTYNGIDIGSRKNFIAINGLVKSRKSVIASAIISGLIKGDFLGFANASGGPLNIFHIDTEQGEGHYLRMIHRILKDSGKSDMQGRPTKPDSFNSVECRSAENDFRVSLIDFCLAMHKPDVLVIDGVTDLVDDINDQSAAKAIGQKLMRWSVDYNCLIIVVIHLTKSTKAMTGAVGTTLEKKCQTAISVVKDEKEDQFSHIHCQHSRDIGFKQFSIQFDEKAGHYVRLHESDVELKGKFGDHSPENYKEWQRTSLLDTVYRLRSAYKDRADLNRAIYKYAGRGLGEPINAEEANKFSAYFFDNGHVVQSPDGVVLSGFKKRLDESMPAMDFVAGKEEDFPAQDEDLAQYMRDYPENNVGNNLADDLPF